MYTVTDKVLYVVNGAHIEHEIHDTKMAFRHRLVHINAIGTRTEGEWTPFEWLAMVDAEGRRFAASQDNWQPMFPWCFEMVVGVAKSVQHS